MLNDNVILITQQQKKVEEVTPVLAGRPVLTPKQTDTHHGEDTPIVDAWAQWKQKHPGQSAFSSTTSAPSVAPAPRQIEGPVTTKFAEQDAKIETLTRRLEDLNQQFQQESQAIRSDVQQTVRDQGVQFTQFCTAG